MSYHSIRVSHFVACPIKLVIISFQSLLHDPNPNSPANNEAAQLYRENRREYEKKVAAIVQESWNDDDDE